jgi:3-oxoacyl-[acyl-carrier protein] reductase
MPNQVQNNSRISTDLSGQVAIVTGAARGLGRAIAQTLAGAGAKLACVDVDEQMLAETVDAINSAAGTAEAIACNVTDSDRVGQIVQQVANNWGGLHILVYVSVHSRRRQTNDETAPGTDC